MKRSTKIWLAIATSLLFVGTALFAVTMALCGWDFSSLATVEYSTTVHEIEEGFDNISVNTDTAKIIFALADDDKCRVECYEDAEAKHSVSVEDGTLVITKVNEKKWYENIGINLGSQKITVFLPRAEYASLRIDESTGDVEIPTGLTLQRIDVSVSTGNVKCYAVATEAIKISATTGSVRVQAPSAGAIDVSVSTGKVIISNTVCLGEVKVGVSTGKTELTSVECKSLTSSGSTGDILLNNVIVEEGISIKRSTGDVNLDGADAGEIFIETDTGDVEGTLLSEKVFIARSDTGDIDVPKTTGGGRCEITTDTGDINLKIK